MCEVYFMLAQLNEVLDQLRHFCGMLRRFSEIFRITPCFCSGGSSNVVDVAHYLGWGYLGLFLGSSHSVYSLPVLF